MYINGCMGLFRCLAFTFNGCDYLGLLGTNNNEQYDEFLKPDKTIAKSVAEFANAWEVSGDRECKVSSSERKVKILKYTCSVF